MIRESEAAKIRMNATPGEYGKNFNSFLHTAYVDEEYLVFGSHVDETLQKRIINHEFIDFRHLLPRDRVSVEEDQRMELVNRNGLTYWSPVIDREIGVISNFHKWETAFRVFSNIYTMKYPNKAAELIQYCHVIHTASLTYVWENVYFYDKEFRIHMSKHPQCSWAVILQQAWNLRLKDKLKFDNFSDCGKHHKSKEIC